jgi:NADPH-dependent ferric siderophore reductase
VVDRVEALTPRMTRVTLTGGELHGLTVEQPAASVRLLLPPPGREDLVMPEWDGNQFLLPGGERAPIRTFTPRRFDATALELDLWIVVHGTGAGSEWAASARGGDPAAVSGTGRGYDVPSDAPGFLLAGDETAIPAISQLLEHLSADTPVAVHVEVAHPDARFGLTSHPRATVAWHDLPEGATPGEALVPAVAGVDIEPGTRVWAAGEAAAMFRLRRHLSDERAWDRSLTTVRGYWRHGRSGE